MIERFVNLLSVDVEQAVMGIARIKDVEKPIFVPGICPNRLCKELPPTATHCPECGKELTEEALSNTERRAWSVRENPLSLGKMVFRLSSQHDLHFFQEFD
jgi:hypothetical protein